MKKYNNNFYKLANELVSRANGNDNQVIIDHSTFIDFGIKFSEYSDSAKDDFCNNFLNNLISKIMLTVDKVETYNGELKSLVKGTIAPGGVVEVILHQWFNATAAGFVNLSNGQSVADQWKIQKPEVETYLFQKAVPFTLFYTVNAIELESAFKSESALETFLNNTMTYFLNSKEEILTSIRRALLASCAIDTIKADAVTSDTESGQRYKLLTMYNAINDLEGEDALTVEDCLYNTEFVRYAVSVMTKVGKKMKDPSIKFNLESFKTFTSADRLRKYILSDFVGAMDAYTIQDLRRPQSLGDFEEISFLQSPNYPLQVYSLEPDYVVAVLPESGLAGDVYYLTTDGKYYTYSSSDTQWKELEVEDENKSAPIVAIFADDYANRQYIERQSMRTTPVNAVSETYNIYSNNQVLNCRLKAANSVIFTLE